MKTIEHPRPATLAGLDAAREFFAPMFLASMIQERLVVAHVDEQGRCIGLIEHDGMTDHVDMPVRQILGDAVQLGSAGLALAHNHPAGDARPSRADVQATRRLAVAGEAIDLAVVDHLVFGADTSCSSMRRLGYL